MASWERVLFWEVLLLGQLGESGVSVSSGGEICLFMADS